MAILDAPVTAEVALQGDPSLVLLDHFIDRAVFRVVGFERPIITLIDRRTGSVRALERVLKWGGIKSFAPHFNTPASVTIDEDKSGNVLIELGEPARQAADYILWIAVGLESTLPVQRYEFCRHVALDQRRIAVASLLRKTAAFHPQTLSVPQVL